MGTGLAVAGLVASIVGTGASIVEGKKVRSGQKEQSRRVQATNAAKAATAKRQALREERVRRAQLASQAEAAGIGGSSTAISGEALSGTLASQKVGQVSSALETTNVLSAGNQSIAESQQRQQLFGNIAQIGLSVFQTAGGFGEGDSSTPAPAAPVPQATAPRDVGIGGRRR